MVIGGRLDCGKGWVGRGLMINQIMMSIIVITCVVMCSSCIRMGWGEICM